VGAENSGGLKKSRGGEGDWKITIGSLQLITETGKRTGLVDAMGLSQKIPDSTAGGNDFSKEGARWNLEKHFLTLGPGQGDGGVEQ